MFPFSGKEKRGAEGVCTCVPCRVACAVSACCLRCCVLSPESSSRKLRPLLEFLHRFENNRNFGFQFGGGWLTVEVDPRRPSPKLPHRRGESVFQNVLRGLEVSLGKNAGQIQLLEATVSQGKAKCLARKAYLSRFPLTFQPTF